LKAHLLFQVRAIEFTDLRFTQSPRNEADRTATTNVDTPPPASNIDEQLEGWLKQVRAQNRIEFKKEAFQ